MQVKCSIEKPYTFWTEADFYVQLMYGNAYPTKDRELFAIGSGSGGGDYLYPQDGPTVYSIEDEQKNAVHGTYNCWCICTGGDSSNVTWYASTGGSLIDR